MLMLQQTWKFQWCMDHLIATKMGSEWSEYLKDVLCIVKIAHFDNFVVTLTYLAITPRLWILMVMGAAAI